MLYQAAQNLGQASLGGSASASLLDELDLPDQDLGASLPDFGITQLDTTSIQDWAVYQPGPINGNHPHYYDFLGDIDEFPVDVVVIHHSNDSPTYFTNYSVGNSYQGSRLSRSKARQLSPRLNRSMMQNHHLLCSQRQHRVSPTLIVRKFDLKHARRQLLNRRAYLSAHQSLLRQILREGDNVIQT